MALEAIIVSCLYSKAIKGVIPEASDILQVLWFVVSLDANWCLSFIVVELALVEVPIMKDECTSTMCASITEKAHVETSVLFEHPAETMRLYSYLR